MPGRRLSSSPVVADGVLVAQVETDGEAFIAGSDVLTGINRWKTERPKRADWTSPLVLRGGDGKPLVALQSSAGITALEPATGKEIPGYVLLRTITRDG